MNWNPSKNQNCQHAFTNTLSVEKIGDITCRLVVVPLAQVQSALEGLSALLTTDGT